MTLGTCLMRNLHALPHALQLSCHAGGANELQGSDISEELEALRLKYGEISRGFDHLESLTCWQAIISTVFAVTGTVAAFYFSISAFYSGIFWISLSRIGM